MSRNKYLRKHPPLRGGWDVGPDEYKSLGFIIGLPPNLYIPATPQITALSEKYESCDSNYIGLESKFNIKERQFMIQSGASSARCYVRDFPPNMNPKQLKDALNAKLFQRRITSTPHSITQVVINPNNEYAFIEFEKTKEADKFVQLRDSFELEGHTLRIRPGHRDFTNETLSGEIPQERLNSFIIYNISDNDTEQSLKDLISVYAAVEKVQIPAVSIDSNDTSNYFQDFIGDNNSKNYNNDKNMRRLGYAIVDLQDTKLVNIVVLQLKIIHNLDCRRCFPRIGQGVRKTSLVDNIEMLKLDKQREINKYSLFIEDRLKDYSVADILNLDIDISKLQSDIPSNTIYTKLRIFNVLKSQNKSEIDEVVADMKLELSAFARVVDVYADIYWDDLSMPIGIPVVGIFKTPEDAYNAQKGISGRKYKGRIVITMLADE
ncbi:Splicing factor [Tritrichomonas musculus]|uniref:Splicing factor n=1 Tax=Tritrichomonas musculus TaxID=1915356 RepID=A0ABR2IP65_9EUKA